MSPQNLYCHLQKYALWHGQLSSTDHISIIVCACRFALYNSYLSEFAAQLLVQALAASCLEYYSAPLTRLQFCAIRSLLIIQSANPKRTHVTPLFISLYWLPLSDHCTPSFSSLANCVLPRSRIWSLHNKDSKQIFVACPLRYLVSSLSQYVRIRRGSRSSFHTLRAMSGYIVTNTVCY